MRVEELMQTLWHQMSVCRSRGQALHAVSAKPLQLHQSPVDHGIKPKSLGVDLQVGGAKL